MIDAKKMKITWAKGIQILPYGQESALYQFSLKQAGNLSFACEGNIFPPEKETTTIVNDELIGTMNEILPDLVERKVVHLGQIFKLQLRNLDLLSPAQLKRLISI